MPNVLVFTPTWETAPGVTAIHPECQAAIMAQRDTFGGVVDWCVGITNPYPIGDHRNVLSQYQEARKLFLSDAYYDALLAVEHDNVMTAEDTLARMYGTQADVVYAPYQLRHGAYCLNTWQYIGDEALGMSLTGYPDELAQYIAAGVGRVSGTGMGCTLFRRHVLEHIPFRSSGATNYAPDLAFAMDALRAGFVSMGRFDVPVAHFDGDERLGAFDAMRRVKVLAVQTVNAIAAGEFLSITAGEQYELLPLAAADLVRTGYATIVQDDSAPEAAAMVTPETAAMPRARGRKAR